MFMKTLLPCEFKSILPCPPAHSTFKLSYHNTKP